MIQNKDENLKHKNQVFFVVTFQEHNMHTTPQTHVFSVKIYILYSCKKIHSERNHHNFKSTSPLCTTSLVTVPPLTMPGHAKKTKTKQNKPLPPNKQKQKSEKQY